MHISLFWEILYSCDSSIPYTVRTRLVLDSGQLEDYYRIVIGLNIAVLHRQSALLYAVSLSCSFLLSEVIEAKLS